MEIMKMNNDKIKISKEELKMIYKDYDFDLSSLDYDDETLNILQAFNKLNPADKIILELYAELQSQRKTAAILNVSRTSIVKCLNDIRNKIKQRC